MKRHKEKRPWGEFNRFTLNEKSTVKIIRVKPNQKLSLQSHKLRSEFWYILEGNGKVTIGKKQCRVKKGDEIKFGKQVRHRIEAFGKGLVFLEIALGHFSEKDEKRIEDSYGRED